jgi:hypothetical protein
MSVHYGSPPPLGRPTFPSSPRARTRRASSCSTARCASARTAACSPRRPRASSTGLGCEVRIYDPRDLPVKGPGLDEHPEVLRLRELSRGPRGRCGAQPEMHGAITGVFKNQIDWIPLAIGAVRPTQGRTLAVMQVSGGRSRSTR